MMQEYITEDYGIPPYCKGKAFDGSKNLTGSLAKHIDFPPISEDSGFCLTCDTIPRKRFSWFCSDICERKYIDKQVLG